MKLRTLDREILRLAAVPVLGAFLRIADRRRQTAVRLVWQTAVRCQPSAVAGSTGRPSRFMMRSAFVEVQGPRFKR